MAECDPEFFTDNKTHRLVLGNSFKTNSHTAFHTVRYDFKPASVDQQQEGELEVGDANEVTVSLPHIQGSKTACTAYKGSKKPAQKECVLIFDHVTGDFTLERITSQVQVKKTRDSGNANFSSHPALGPTAPKLPKVLTGISKKTSKSASISRTLNKKPEPSHKRNEDNPYSAEASHMVAKSTIATLAQPEPEKTDKQSVYSTDESHSSSSSSSSSSSDDDSGSSSDENGPEMPNLQKPPITPSLLHEDLELSESGSDSD